MFNPKLPANKAIYRYTHNTLFLGFNTGLNADKEALIVHECTHAAMDIAGKTLQRNYSEAAAYIAQCLFFFYKNKAALSKPGIKPKFRSSLLRKAWEVAMKALKSSVLTNKDIKPLLSEIAKHPLYKRRHLKNVAYDGV